MRAVIAAVLVSCLVLTPAPTSGRVLVGLGDSFSAGDGAPPYNPATATGPNPCRQSVWSWQRIVADALRHDVVHLACSGAELPEITEGLPSNGQPMRQTAQLSRMPPNPDMTAMSIGGNDVGFADVLGACVGLP